MTNWIDLFVFSIAVCFWYGYAVRHGDKCKFPSSWRGDWYQSEFQDLHIRSRHVKGKGHCVQSQGDYFLLKDKESNCYRCLLILERHRNILQYKETHCMPQNSPKLAEICRQIRIEANMFTLVREPATTLICPMTEAYFFTYDDGHFGNCDKALSHAKPCVGSEKVQLHFEHCNKLAPMHAVDVDLECIAAWKEGFDFYMYGKLSGPTIDGKERGYRCFKYEFHDGSMIMTMSLDSTCRGLSTPGLGAITMHMEKDVIGWPEPVCKHPAWLAGLTWRSVDGDQIFMLNGDTTTLFGFVPEESGLVLRNEYRCIDIVKQKEDTWILLAFVTTSCHSQLMCMKIKLLTDSVMILQFGDLANGEEGDQCISGIEYTQTRLILPNTENIITCPYPGIYPSQENCFESLTIGCRNSSSIQLNAKPSCRSSRSMSVDCRAFWEEGDVTHIIAQNNMHSKGLDCYSFRQKGKLSEWGSDPGCASVIARGFTSKDALKFSAHSDNCFISKDKSNENEVIKWGEMFPNPNPAFVPLTDTGYHAGMEVIPEWNSDYDNSYLHEVDMEKRHNPSTFDKDQSTHEKAFESSYKYGPSYAYNGDIEHGNKYNQRQNRNSNVQPPPNVDYSISNSGHKFQSNQLYSILFITVFSLFQSHKRVNLYSSLCYCGIYVVIGALLLNTIVC